MTPPRARAATPHLDDALKFAREEKARGGGARDDPVAHNRARLYHRLRGCTTDLEHDMQVALAAASTVPEEPEEEHDPEGAWVACFLQRAPALSQSSAHTAPTTDVG